MLAAATSDLELVCYVFMEETEGGSKDGLPYLWAEFTNLKLESRTLYAKISNVL